MMQINKAKRDPDFFKRQAHGLIDGIATEEVLARIKYLARKIDDFHEDDFIDLYLLRESHKQHSFILSLNSPFKLVVFSNEQLNYLLNYRPSTLFLDGTGCTVRNRIF